MANSWRVAVAAEAAAAAAAAVYGDDRGRACLRCTPFIKSADRPQSGALVVVVVVVVAHSARTGKFKWRNNQIKLVF